MKKVFLNSPTGQNVFLIILDILSTVITKTHGKF